MAHRPKIGLGCPTKGPRREKDLRHALTVSPKPPRSSRIASDQAQNNLFHDELKRGLYWQNIQDECQDSALIALLEEALDQPGDVIECGVYRGRSLRMIGATVKTKAPDRTVFGLDSFEGFPDGGVSEADTGPLRGVDRLMGKFKDADDAPARLRLFAETFDVPIELRKGYFESTLPGVVDRQFCFLHLDSDTYGSHMEVLTALYDRIVPGGIIVYDDYDDTSWPGATQAVDEFFADKPEQIEKSTTRAQPAWFMRKHG